MLYTKFGSIPTSNTDGTDGWTPVEDPPEVPDGKEVVWWFPPGWVIRDIRPEPVEGHEWNWIQTEQKWILYQLPTLTPDTNVILLSDPVRS